MLPEGRSLLPLLRGADVSSWRDVVVSELDYAYREARRILDRPPDSCRAWMARTEAWKYVHWLDLPPQLFDLAQDPDELQDLGRSPSHENVRREMRERLLEWFMSLKRRVTVTNDQIVAGTAAHKQARVYFGQW